MKTIIKVFLHLPIILFAQKNDSLQVQLSCGTSIGSYYSDKLKIDHNSIGYRLGLGVIKSLHNNFIVSSNIWFQNVSFANIKTSIYDEYYNANVHLTTSVNFQQAGFSCEINKSASKFMFGINGGINYLIKSKTTQLIEVENNPVPSNIYQKYNIYDYQKDSFYSTINPFIGISISYFPFVKYGVKYENNFNLIPNPWMSYQYFQNFYSFTHHLMFVYKFN